MFRIINPSANIFFQQPRRPVYYTYDDDDEDDFFYQTCRTPYTVQERLRRQYLQQQHAAIEKEKQRQHAIAEIERRRDQKKRQRAMEVEDLVRRYLEMDAVKSTDAGWKKRGVSPVIHRDDSALNDEMHEETHDEDMHDEEEIQASSVHDIPVQDTTSTSLDKVTASQKILTFFLAHRETLQSLSHLRRIHTSLRDLVSSPSFQAVLSAPTSKGILEMEERLTRLVVEADGVESFGCGEVRRRRRELVREVLGWAGKVEEVKRGESVGTTGDVEVAGDVEMEG